MKVRPIYGLMLCLVLMLFHTACFYEHPLVGIYPEDSGTEVSPLYLFALLSGNTNPAAEITSTGSPEINLLLTTMGSTLSSGSTCTFRNGENCFPEPVSFTIQNLGTADLNLASVGVDNTSDFTLTPPGSTTIASSSSTTFTINNPTSGCCITGTLTILSNDADEGSYTVNLIGDNS